MTIENIMFLALGFLVAAFMAIIAMPSIWKRAVRLTKKRIEAATPITMAEFRADKDQLRAEFALTQRRLERNVEALRSRLTEQLTEFNTTKTELAVATNERDRLRAIHAEMTERAEANAERLRELERDIADLSQKLRSREREIEELRSGQAAGQAQDPVVAIRSSLSRDTASIASSADSVSDAYERISRAGKNLNALLDETGAKPAHKSLAEALSQEDQLNALREKIAGVENDIAIHWGDGSLDKGSLRDRLDDIASATSQIIYAAEGDKAEEAEQSLFDRIRKFTGDALEAEEVPLQEQKQRASLKSRAVTGNTLSDRIAAFQNLQANS